ncbi:hypothetical protein A0H81_02203 [Grifola frondosa]|uniref:Chitin-binding type-3 domain-containing protein n=1 Tax=Grifola frondosa TaxID=5627 RepID=A0A1C7MPE0_GRIFR|nr:hypothetical protein A0H81_02203 [Grifola frondosa]
MHPREIRRDQRPCWFHFWDLSTDKVGTDSLVGTTAGVYGSLDQTQNHIDYPDSEWDNIRNNMGSTTSSSSAGSPTSSSTSTPATSSPTSTPTTSSPTSTPTTGSGQCSSASAWSATATYTGGMEAIYNGDLWTAKWWTLGDTPGGAAGVWTDDGAC